MAISGKIISKFTTKRTFRVSKNAVNKALKVVAKEIERDIKKRLDKPFPPASRPGQSPHKRTGRLQRSVIATAGNGTIRVRTVNYGLFLEKPRDISKSRPFVAPVLLGAKNKKKWEKKIATLTKKSTGGSRKRVK